MPPTRQSTGPAQKAAQSGYFYYKGFPVIATTNDDSFFAFFILPYSFFADFQLRCEKVKDC